jgi:hypothetical protein
MAAPTWCSSPTHSCADWSASSHRLGAIWFATRACSARPAKARSKLRALIPATITADAATCPIAGTPIPMRARRLPWPDLLRRVFAQDVLTCPCGGRRSVTAFVTDQRLASSLLASLGLPAEPATFAPARDPPQAELAWDEPA